MSYACDCFFFDVCFLYFFVSHRLGIRFNSLQSPVQKFRIKELDSKLMKEISNWAKGTQKNGKSWVQNPRGFWTARRTQQFHFQNFEIGSLFWIGFPNFKPHISKLPYLDLWTFQALIKPKKSSDGLRFKDIKVLWTCNF